jgi:hypothetical protein
MNNNYHQQQCRKSHVVGVVDWSSVLRSGDHDRALVTAGLLPPPSLSLRIIG